MVDAEINIPPAEFNDYLRLIGGVNRYDENHFRVAWSQYETFIAGGSWSVGEASFTGYRRLLIGSGEPCWCLLQWHDAAEYGSPEAYYVHNCDESTGLQTLGEYPYSGRYELLYNLRWHEIDGAGRLQLRSIPLNTRTFDLIIPIIIAAKDISLAKRKEAFLEARRQEENSKLADIERHMRDNAVPFQNAVSYGRQGIRSTAVDQKILDLQRAWSDLQAAAKRFKLGMQTA